LNPTENLFQEHRLIERVLRSFQAFVHGFASREQLDRCEFGRFVTFFREFADLHHHEKEETLIMPALVEAGVPWDQGVLAELRRQHEYERQLLQRLRHLALRNGDWSAHDRHRIQEVVRQFSEFMHEHVRLEDDQLEPLVRTRLTESKQRSLGSKLQQFDESRMRSGELSMLTELGEELAKLDQPTI